MGLHLPRKAPPDLAQRVSSGDPVLVVFATPDAPACTLDQPVLVQVERRYEGRLSVVHVDAQQSPGEAAAFEVVAVPTFVLFVGGGERVRLVGYQSVEDLTRALDEVLPPAA